LIYSSTIAATGQKNMSVQVPQSVHFSGSILEMPWPPPAMIAPWGQTLAHALQVMQCSKIL
jgi:hypothetical protein